MTMMKTIFEMEDIRRLRLCVMKELLSLGISIPKSYKSSGSLSRKSKRLQAKAKKENQPTTAIFGMPLCDIPSDFIEGCGYVPRFLVDAVNYIEANILTIGLFRKTGSVHRQKELRRIIENGGSVKCAKLVDDVANLIKQFMREMPESLITSTLEGHFMKALDIDDNETQLKAISLLSLLLPLDHIGTLRYITIMLSHIVTYSHVNKMDCSNLALVMTPNVMYCRVSDSSALLCDEKQLAAQTALVELLIRNSSLIGTVTPEMEERVQLEISMDSVTHATDDEDNADPKVVKKKRRSGSLQGMMSSIEQNLKSWRSKKSSFSNNSIRSDQSAVSDEGISSCTDMSTASSTSSLNPGKPKTPVLRKRKAEEDPTGLSKKKVRTIVKNLPQQSILAGAQFDVSGMSMSFRGNHTFPSTQSSADNNKKDDPAAALFTSSSASFTQEATSTKKRFPSPFRRKVRRVPSAKTHESSAKNKKRIFRLLSVNHDSSKAKQTRDSVNGLLRCRKKTTSSPGRVLDGHCLKSPRSACSTPTTSITDEKVFIIEDKSEISNLAGNLEMDLFDGDLSPPSPDCSLSAEMMASSSKPWNTSRRDGGETPTKNQIRRGRPNTPTNGLHPALKKKYCHEQDAMEHIDPENIDELDSSDAHVTVIVCNSKNRQFSSGFAKDLFGESDISVTGADIMTTL